MDESADMQTQPALEKASGVGQSTISRVLKGETGVGLDQLAALAEAFDVPPFELLVDDESTRASVYNRILGPKEGRPAKEAVHKRVKKPGRKNENRAG